MFEQKKPAEYQPKNKVKPSVGKIVMPKMGGDADNEEVAKNSESVDDRPKELTTSLLSARAMFEGGNRASDSSIVKEVASWDGKGSSDVQCVWNEKKLGMGMTAAPAPVLGKFGTFFRPADRETNFENFYFLPENVPN